jgi:TRAP-type C4-dicarboxylate transport system substrate-binding protein
VALLLWFHPAFAQATYKPEYRMSVAVGPSYAWGKGAEAWATLVKERTGGRISIRVFPGAAATGGDPANEFEALRTRAVDLAVGSALNWAPQVKPLHLFALPFFVGSDRRLDAILAGSPGAALFRAVADAGVVPLAWGDHGFRALATTDRAIRKPDDVAGLRIRISGPAIFDDIVAMLGGAPVRSKWPDAQKALLDGSLNGTETSPAQFLVTKAQTLGLKHLTLWNLAAEPLIFAVNKAAWDEWTEADRELVRGAARDAATKEIAQARGSTAAANERIGRDLRGAVAVLRPDAAQRAAFAAALEPVFRRWSAAAGEALVADALHAADATGDR